MSTFSTNPVLKIAEKDIEVFKLIKLVNEDRYAPFRLEKYKTNDISIYDKISVISDESDREKNKKSIKDKFESPYIYQSAKDFEYIYSFSEGIHSYLNYADAVENKAYLKSIFSSQLFIVKAIIPKGSRYYEGFSRIDNGKKLSSKITFDEPTIISERLILLD